MEQSVFWIALSFGVHIAMVNLGIFLAIIVPYLKYRADKTGDEGLDQVAYRLMKFYAATYAIAGVYGTAFTVFLLSFYPGFIGLAGHLTLIPFGLAIIMIAIHFFSITAFYYGWNRWSRGAHYIIGILLAISSILIPLGFRVVFAFLNIPVGLTIVDGGLKLDVVKALTGNPTFAPLYIKSIVGAITAGALVVIGGLLFSYHRTLRSDYKKGIEDTIKLLIPVALIGLILMPIIGLWYALSLREVPYKFNNIFSSLGWKVEEGIAYYNVSWLFVIKLILYVLQLLVIALMYSKLRTRSLKGIRPAPLLYTGIAALATIVIGEYVNAFSQYPCFIAALASAEGCIIPSGLPKELAAILNLHNYNMLATIKPVIALTIAFMAFLTLAVIYFFYVLLIKEERR